MNRTREAIGSLAVAALLGLTLTAPGSIAAQDTSRSPAATTETQTESDAIAAAIATGKYPFGARLVLMEGAANVRNAAGAEAATLTELDEGDIVTVQAGPEQVGGADWYQVETDGGITGWVDARQFGVAAGAAPLDPGAERQVITASLNLRAEPGVSGDVISGLAQGDTVTIVSGPQLDGDLDWYEVQTVYGEDGWLAAVYLGAPGAAANSAATAAGAQTDATPTAATTADFPEGSYIFVNSDTLNLRADASIDAEIVIELSDGEVGIVTGAPVRADEYDWYPVSFGTGDATVTGYVAGSLISGGITVGSTAVVADGPLNLRDDTTAIDGEPIGQLETGDVVTVVSGPIESDAIVWFEVQSGDTNGYVAGRYLGPETTATSTPTPTE